MQDSFATPAMTSVTMIVFILEVLSMLVLAIVLLAFGQTQRKKKGLFFSLYDGPSNFPRHRVVVTLYILMTIGIGAVSAALYVSQPHFL